MESTRAIAQDLASQGDVCARMGSRFYGALFAHAAAAYTEDAVLRGLLERHGHRSRIGLRLGAAAHFRALRRLAPEIAAHYPSTGGDGDADAAWRAVLADVHANVDAYDRRMAGEVQTNEVGRAMLVLAAMLAVADAVRMPLRVLEIGASAGLLLNFDRYAYRGDSWSWGDPGSPAQLRNRIASGAPKHVQAPLRIVERRGCDLNPLDPAREDDAGTLLSFVWPDQAERLRRLRAAIEIARAHPVKIDRANGIAWARTAAMPREGVATVLLHTVITEHMPPPERESLIEVVDELARSATSSQPFAWVRMEPGERGYHTIATHWPANEELFIARSDGHAQNIRWYPASAVRS